VPNSRLFSFALGLLCAAQLHADFSLVSGVSLEGGVRVVSHYDAPDGSDLVLSTRSVRGTDSATHIVEIFALSRSGALTQVSAVALGPLFGAADTLLVSSMAADPLSRGFGVATVIPADNTRVRGKLVFFDLPDGSILRVVEVGFHPESVTFTPDGTRVIVANEGEFAANRPQAPGSISVVSLPAHPTAASLLANPPPVTTIDFKHSDISNCR